AFVLSLLLPAAALAEDANRGHLKMALVCLKSLSSDGPDAGRNKANLKANLDRHLYFVDQRAARGAEFIGFPELSLNGYHFSKNMTWLSLDGPEVGALKKKAAEKRRLHQRRAGRGRRRRQEVEHAGRHRPEGAGRRQAPQDLADQGEGLHRGRRRPRGL